MTHFILTNKVLTGVAAVGAVAVLAAVGVSGRAGTPPIDNAGGVITLAAQEQTGFCGGKVLTSEGEPAPKVVVSLYQNNFGDKGGGGGKGGLGKQASVPPAPNDLQSDNPKYGPPIGKAVSDAEGKFKIAKPLQPGYYRIEAGNRATVGFRATSVQVKSGETTDIELKLTKARNSPSAGGASDGDDRR